MRTINFKLDFNHEIIFENSILMADGLSEMSTIFDTSNNAGVDGTIINGESKASRTIGLKIHIDEQDTDRLERYFAKKQEHTLYIGKRKIRCVCELSKIGRGDRGNLYERPYLLLQLLCADPYFYDIYNFGKNLAGVQPMLGFPWTSTKNDGFATGYRLFNRNTIFTNKGDTNVGIKVLFKAVNGIAENIRFTNLSTNEFVEVITDMSQGDELEISTVQGEKYIRKNGKDIFNSINRKSVFFSLNVGDNMLEYSAKTGETNLEVYLYYVPKYANGVVLNSESA